MQASGRDAPRSTLPREPSASYIVSASDESNPPAAGVSAHARSGLQQAHIWSWPATSRVSAGCSAPDASATAYSKLCGSTITVDLALKDGKVADYAQELKACALGQASASILARNIVGATPEELRELRETMRQMLKENGPPPDGKWADLAVLEPVRDYKARHGSTLLAFRRGGRRAEEDRGGAAGLTRGFAVKLAP